MRSHHLRLETVQFFLSNLDAVISSCRLISLVEPPGQCAIEAVRTAALVPLLLWGEAPSLRRGVRCRLWFLIGGLLPFSRPTPSCFLFCSLTLQCSGRNVNLESNLNLNRVSYEFYQEILSVRGWCIKAAPCPQTPGSAVRETVTRIKCCRQCDERCAGRVAGQRGTQEKGPGEDRTTRGRGA